jgi:ribosome maturation factor RimP
MTYVGEGMSAIQAEIEEQLSELEPQVEVLLAEIVGGSIVRLYIDHPDGVSLALCERVTRHLAAVRERYSLEVSSPGTDRPLTKPDHFRRYLGQRARVRLREAPGGHRRLTGELVGATDAEITLAADDGVVSIPYGEIVRSNLVPGE